MRFFLTVCCSVMTLLPALSLAAEKKPAAASSAISEDEEQVRVWNIFADNLYQLHLRQLRTAAVRETERTGGYKDQPDFFREVVYTDARSGRILSRIEWERKRPERIHAIEVYIYDAQGRLVRDYMAWFLPEFRNAPRQTTINLYHYGDGLRGWRQFDASGRRIYEKCTNDKQVTLIEMQQDEIARAAASSRGSMQEETYQGCFGGLDTEADDYLTPN
jgi:hypothetical protein